MKPVRGVMMLYCVFSVACVASGAVPCPFGTCPQGTACDVVHDRCVEPDQLMSCVGLPDETECAAGNAPGICVDEVCLERGCGDLYVNGPEQCDGERFIDAAAGCDDVGYYGSGPIRCNADCTIDDSACAGLSYCGDGVYDEEHEACDFMAADATATCSALGFHQGDVAPCTPFCTFLTVGNCDERCGDGTVNGPELCEPSAGPPAYLSCLDYGFDGGQLACGLTCTAEDSACAHYELWPAGGASARMNDLWQASPTDAFVVGESIGTGLVLRWNGAALEPVAPAAGEILQSVSGSSSTNVIAVGNNGRIARFDGTTLTEMVSGTTQGLMAVHVLGPTAAWAVGDNGTILHFDGTTWSPMSSGTSQDLRAVWATTPTDIWALGATSAVFHSDGTTWTGPVNVTGGAVIHQLWGTAPDNVFAVGDNGEIRHFDGNTWSKQPSPTTLRLLDVWGSSADNVLAVGGSGIVLRFDGTRWVALERTQTTGYRSISGVAADNALVLDPDGRVLQWAGAGWTDALDLPAAPVAIWGTAPTNRYALTSSQVVHFDGTAWAEVATAPSVSTPLHAIWGSGPNDIFAVGTNVILHYTGVLWEQHVLPAEATDVPLRGVWGSSASDVFAIGDGGLVLHYNGVSWSFSTQLTASPTAIWGVAANAIWVVGTDTIHFFNGADWIQQDSGRALSAIWGTSASNVWAVGLAGLVLRFDDVADTWNAVPDDALGTTRDLDAIHGTGPDDIFVSGQDALLHYDGARWTPIDSRFATSEGVWVETGYITLVGTPGHARTLVRSCVTCL